MSATDLFRLASKEARSRLWCPQLHHETGIGFHYVLLSLSRRRRGGQPACSMSLPRGPRHVLLRVPEIMGLCSSFRHPMTAPKGLGFVIDVREKTERQRHLGELSEHDLEPGHAW